METKNPVLRPVVIQSPQFHIETSRVVTGARTGHLGMAAAVW